jgi:hypothetical protein
VNNKVGSYYDGYYITLNYYLFKKFGFIKKEEVNLII